MAKLDTAALAELTRIVRKFTSLRVEILETDQEVQRMMKKGERLKAEYAQAMEDEKKLFETLRAAYGPGGLDPVTLAWVETTIDQEYGSVKANRN